MNWVFKLKNTLEDYGKKLSEKTSSWEIGRKNKMQQIIRHKLDFH